MPKAVRVHRNGGPEVLSFEDVDVPPPGEGEVRLRQTAIGLNFIDVYLRTGLYPSALPMVLGQEGVGVVESVGAGVEELEKGDRVAYAGLLGGYAEVRNAAAARVVKIPDGISDETAAGMMLKGMTAEYLLRRTHAVTPGETVLFHSAAGGVGSIACQWAKALGATVIGAVGSDEKAVLARQHGCDHVIVTARENIARRVREITDGRGVSVVYDSVGKDTFEASLDSLERRGLMVSFGNSSGPVPPFEPRLLNAKGSLFLTRPSLQHYTHTREELVDSANTLFDVVLSGQVTIDVRQRFALKDAAQAHAALESRKTTGATVLLP